MNLLFVIAALAVLPGDLPAANPQDVGLSTEILNQIPTAIQRVVDDAKIPGAVVIVGRRGKIVLAGAFGNKSVSPELEPMTRDTIFDLASLTKPIATASSIMRLSERGDLKLSDRLGDVLPEFDNHGKGAITVEQLLRHRSGLIADNPISDYHHGVDEAWKRLGNLDLIGKPGAKFLYSDVNFEILGRIVEKRSGMTLNAFADREIFQPLGMKSTSFFVADPPRETKRFAPTERDGQTMLRGIVHDPRSRALGGVAGHAGLFGTADDLAVFAQMILDEGRTQDGRVILKPETIRAIIDPGDTPDHQKRGLGWDIETPFSAPKGKIFGPHSFGHTGFTGTSLWIDPESRMFVILLTSRLHPDGKGGSLTAMRSEIATIAGRAILNPP